MGTSVTRQVARATVWDQLVLKELNQESSAMNSGVRQVLRLFGHLSLEISSLP